MQWQTDWGLRGRMAFTGFLLFALYIVFAGILVQSFSVGIFPMLIMLGGFSLVQYYFSDTLALKSMGAREVSEEEQPELHDMVTRLSRQADLPKPKIAVADSRVPNAFATGRNQKNATVCVTTGIMGTLNQEELEGVMAHELAHIKNRDVMVMTIASFLSTIAFIIVRWGWLFSGGGDARSLFGSARNGPVGSGPAPVARRIAAEAIVLVKNQDNALPLARDGRAWRVS